jgi:hypothetical protein
MHRAEMRDAWQSWITDAMTQCLRETAFNGARRERKSFMAANKNYKTVCRCDVTLVPLPTPLGYRLTLPCRVGRYADAGIAAGFLDLMDFSRGEP